MTPDTASYLHGPEAAAYAVRRIAHWDLVAEARDERRGATRSYHQRLTHVYRYLVATGQRVLELGCGDGELLAALVPATGVGVDFSSRMVDTTPAGLLNAR